MYNSFILPRRRRHSGKSKSTISLKKNVYIYIRVLQTKCKATSFYRYCIGINIIKYCGAKRTHIRLRYRRGDYSNWPRTSDTSAVKRLTPLRMDTCAKQSLRDTSIPIRINNYPTISLRGIKAQKLNWITLIISIGKKVYTNSGNRIIL